MKIMIRAFIVLALSLPTLASAQGVIVRADRMLDVRSGRIIENAVVSTSEGLIESVGSAQAQQGQEIIDLGDVTLLPGLIDMHTHLTLDLYGDYLSQMLRESPAETALRGARNAAATLRAGFTTVRDLSSYDFTDVALMRAIDNGYVIGPRIFPSGHGISITGGSADFNGFKQGLVDLGPEEGIADGVDEIVASVRHQIKNGARVVKIYATGGVYSQSAVIEARQYSDEELTAAVEEAKRHHLKITAHGHGTPGIVAAVRAGVDSIEHGTVLDDDAIALMIERGTYLVPTAYLVDAVDTSTLPPATAERFEYVREHARRSHRKAIAAGVKVAFGTDACVFPHGDNAKEFAVLVKLGMSPIEAIRTATINAADLLGVDDRGAIEAGLLADLIAVRGNPLERVETLERVVWVMKGGEVVQP